MDEAKYDSGWYPQPDGRLRWWDGHQWTEHVRGEATGEVGPRGEGTLARTAGRMLDTTFTAPADAIWSAVGRPLSGFGGGRFWLSEHYLSSERGTLKTDAQQVPVSAVIDVDVRQSMTQKARGLFTVLVLVQRPSGIGYVTMEDIADGRAAQAVITGAAIARGPPSPSTGSARPSATKGVSARRPLLRRVDGPGHRPGEGAARRPAGHAGATRSAACRWGADRRGVRGQEGRAPSASLRGATRPARSAGGSGAPHATSSAGPARWVGAAPNPASLTRSRRASSSGTGRDQRYPCP